MKRAFFVMCSLVLAAGFAGCALVQGEAKPKVDVRTVRPCDLLTRQEAIELLGRGVRESTMGSVPNLEESSFVTCVYVGQGTPVSGLSVTLFGRLDPASARAMFQASKDRQIAEETHLPVENLGDEAFWDHSTLLVRSGEVVFGVTAARSPTEPDLDMAKQVAERVISRIQ